MMRRPTFDEAVAASRERARKEDAYTRMPNWVATLRLFIPEWAVKDSGGFDCPCCQTWYYSRLSFFGIVVWRDRVKQNSYMPGEGWTIRERMPFLLSPLI